MSGFAQPISSEVADFLSKEIRKAEEEIYMIYKKTGHHEYDEQIEADIRNVTVPAYKIIAKRAGEQDDKLAISELAEGLKFIKEKAMLNKIPEEVGDLLGVIGFISLHREEITYKEALKNFRSRGL